MLKKVKIEYPGNIDDLELLFTPSIVKEDALSYKYGYLISKLVGDDCNNSTFSNDMERLNIIESSIPSIMNQRITQITIGFNIDSGAESNDIVVNQIYNHNYNNHDNNLTWNGYGDCKTFSSSTFSMNVGNRAPDFELKENIIPVEITLHSNKILEKLEVISPYSLRDSDKIMNLFKEFFLKFDQLLIVDYFSNKSLDQRTCKRLEYLLNPYTLKKLTKKEKLRMKIGLEKLLIKNNLLTTKNHLKDVLATKFHQYINN